jgi:hypothetical protein
VDGRKGGNKGEGTKKEGLRLGKTLGKREACENGRRERQQGKQEIGALVYLDSTTRVSVER